MSDPASQANEPRLLEQRRLRTGLTPEEEGRRSALATGASPATAPRGFDVNAAADEVRALIDSSPSTRAPLDPVGPSDPFGAALLEGEPSDAAPADPSPARPFAEELLSLREPLERQEDEVAPAFLAGLDLDAPEPALAEPAPAEPAVEGGAAAAQEPAQAAPVYDAAAYGLDPNDPNAVAWAAWYAEQGWDPATAYAYAQQMNAASDTEGAEAAAGVAPGGELPADVVAPAPADASDRADAGDGFVPAALDEGADALPELPPVELEALDETPVELQPTAGAPAPDVAIDIGPAFEPEPPPADAPPEEPAPSPDSPGAPPAADAGWADLAVPAADGPVDFAAFDAEPALAAPAEDASAAGRDAAGFRGAAGEEPASREEASPATAAPVDPDLPSVDFALAEGGELWPGSPGGAGAGLPSAWPEAAPEAEPADSLELSPPEPLELRDEDILEVGGDVVELPPDELQPVAEPEARHEELSPPAPELEPVTAVEAAAISFASPLEPTLSLGAIAASEAPGDDLEPPTLDLPPLPAEPPVAEPAPAPPPDSHVAGTHRVVVHTADGQVRRGTVTDVALDAGEVLLTPQGGRVAEPIPVDQVKAVFFMLPPGQPPADPEGKKIRVTFRDGRQLAGFSADYAPEHPGFFMVPADARTHTARIWVYRAAVRQVSVG